MKPATSPTGTRPAPGFFSTEVAAARRFFLDLSPPKRRPLAVVCGGLEHCTTGYAIRRESFPFFSIEYVARGRGTVLLRNRAQPLQPGRLFSYGPGVPHDITGNPGYPLVKYFVDFAGRDAALLLNTCRLPPGEVAQVFPPHALAPLFDELIESGLRGGPEGEALCVKLLECLALKIAATRAPAAGAETRAFTTFQECRRHIEQHFHRLRTLEEIAAECHTNDAYLCRLFRRYDHQSPYQYLLRLKMNLAAQRLQQGDCLVKQVGEELGFADPFHFSRVFKGVLGLSPDAFRRMRASPAKTEWRKSPTGSAIED
jgi:AraC-like DNA-binding protein